MRRVLSFVALILLTLLSSACYYNPMPLLGRAAYYPKYEVTQDTDSLLTVHVGKKMDIQFRKLPNRDCWIATTEVSIEQMDYYLGGTQSREYRSKPGYKESWPAMNITVQQALCFCSWLSRHLEGGQVSKGYSVRLPTVEEWEDAARCGTDRLYPWGDEWPPVKFEDGQYPNVMGEDRFKTDTLESHCYLGIPYREEAKIAGYRDGFPSPCPVELAGQNAWGIVGLAGNVEEWCWDEETRDYILKGGYWEGFHPDHFDISKSHILNNKPWPFFPLLADRQSHRGSGFRVVIGPEMK